MVQTAQWFPECKHPHQQFIEFYHWKIVFWDLVNQFSRLNVYIFTNVQGWKWSSLNVFLTVKPMIIGRVQFLLKCVWMFHVFRKKTFFIQYIWSNLSSQSMQWIFQGLQRGQIICKPIDDWYIKKDFLNFFIFYCVWFDVQCWNVCHFSENYSLQKPWRKGQGSNTSTNSCI